MRLYRLSAEQGCKEARQRLVKAQARLNRAKAEAEEGVRKEVAEKSLRGFSVSFLAISFRRVAHASLATTSLSGGQLCHKSSKFDQSPRVTSHRLPSGFRPRTMATPLVDVSADALAQTRGSVEDAALLLIGT